MLQVPEVDRVSVAFGDPKHMPKYDSLPEQFKDWRHNHYCEAVSSWFYSGAKAHENGIAIKDHAYIAKPGVEARKALAAIKAVLGSWEPKHEHKIAACGYMLSEWFDRKALVA